MFSVVQKTKLHGLIETWADLGHHIEVAGHRIPNGVLRFGNSEVRTHHIAVIDRAGRGRESGKLLYLNDSSTAQNQK